MISGADFQKRIRAWYRVHGRHELPWRRTRNPYRIFVSEMMLQQTQVSRVVERYKAFLKKFPTVTSLSRASTASVLREWQGLGYNRRALFMHRAAKIIVDKHRGRFPRDIKDLEALPGVGSYTARAIAVFAWGAREVFVETNIRRVYLHYYAFGKTNVSDADIMPYIQKTVPLRNVREWYWALMDYGANGLKGEGNSNRRSKHYTRQSRFEGSSRYVRALILRKVLERGALSEGELRKVIARDAHAKKHISQIPDITQKMADEGFLKFSRKKWHVNR